MQNDCNIDVSMGRIRFHAFGEDAPEAGRGSSRSLDWNLPFDGADGLLAVKAIQLDEESRPLIDCGDCLLVTHVLRQSPGGLRWRGRAGNAYPLEAGDTLVSRGEAGANVQLLPASRDAACECVCLALQRDFTGDTRTLIAAHDGPYCNSREACVRVILGSYGMRASRRESTAGLRLLDIDIAPASDLEISIPDNFWALAVLGAMRVE
jgi:hypothetical protein